MKKRLLRFTVLLICMAAALVFSTAAEATELSGELIRLHVVANSGSEEDLSLKNTVRDAILSEFFSQPLENLDAERDRIAASLSEIRDLAVLTLAEQGVQTDVQVSFGMRDLPEKDYGEFALPAGRYETLTVTLGAGEGSNWWCVLYPPLCVVPAEAVRDVAAEAGISQNGIELMTGDGESIHLRFKILELLSDLDKQIFGR